MEDKMTVSSGGYKLSVFRDEDAPNPRQWENLGKMVCWHSRYDLGDEHEFEEMSDFLESEEYKNAIVVLPVYIYDHSGLAFSTAPFADKWDSRQVGFIYVTQEQAKEFLGKEIREEDREGIKELLVEEVKTYDQYFQGDCYAFKISDEFGKVVDEDRGYFGNRITDVLKNMKDNVNVEFEGLFGKMEKHSLAYGAMM